MCPLCGLRTKEEGNAGKELGQSWKCWEWRLDAGLGGSRQLTCEKRPPCRRGIEVIPFRDGNKASVARKERVEREIVDAREVEDSEHVRHVNCRKVFGLSLQGCLHRVQTGK